MAEDVCFLSRRCVDDARDGDVTVDGAVGAGDVGGARGGVGVGGPSPREIPTSARDVPQRLAASGEVHGQPEQSIVIENYTLFYCKFYHCKIKLAKRY